MRFWLLKARDCHANLRFARNDSLFVRGLKYPDESAFPKYGISSIPVDRCRNKCFDKLCLKSAKAPSTNLRIVLGPHFEGSQSPYVGFGVPAAYCKMADS